MALPAPTFERFKAYVIPNTYKMYPIVAGPLQQLDPSTPITSSAASTASKSTIQLADEIYAQTRALMSYAWLWHIALSFLPPSGTTRNTTYPAPSHIPPTISHTCWRNLDHVSCMLEGSEWKIQDEHMLWFLGLGYLLAEDAVVRRHYKVRFRRCVKVMGVRDFHGLRTVLEGLMPFERIKEGWDGEECLGGLLNGP